MRKALKAIHNKILFISGFFKHLKNYNQVSRFYIGHYHSPIPNKKEFEEHYNTLGDEITDIDFDFKNQIDILKEFLPFYQEIPWNFSDDFKNISYRYKNKNRDGGAAFYRYSDVIFLYSMMRKVTLIDHEHCGAIWIRKV